MTNDEDESRARTPTAHPADAFGALANETRTTVLRTLARSTEPLRFSTLYDATDEGTTAGFAYHLRQLTDRFVRRVEDRYELTDAGRAAVRAMEGGTYTTRVDRDDFSLGDTCPFCTEDALVATVRDNVTAVACHSCETPLLELSFPPRGYLEQDDLPRAIDRYHRRRIASLADGLCPDCGGAVEAHLELVDEGPPADGYDAGDVDRARSVLECTTCGSVLRCPVSLCVLDYPAVASFYLEHGEDVRARPIWNVGSEWRERVVSTDPWCVAVSIRLGGDELRLYVGADLSVQVHTPTVDAASPSSDESGDESEDGGATA